MRFYVDGKLVDTTAAYGTEPSSGDLSIGCSEEFKDHFKGLIDEVRVYDRALSAEEASDILAPSLTAGSTVSVIHPPGISHPYVLLPEATDPPLANSSPGSRVASYTHRYSLDAEPLVTG
jgi:hypothetical protein